VPLQPLARVLVPTAATGLALAVIAGLLLFMTRPSEYATTPLFFVKLALILAGTVHALAIHLGPGFAGVTAAGRRLAGLTSLGLWITALISGRLLAFVGD
jgi:hypothetical protein